MTTHVHAFTETRPACCCVCSRREAGRLDGERDNRHWCSASPVWISSLESMSSDGSGCITDMSRCPLPEPNWGPAVTVGDVFRTPDEERLAELQRQENAELRAALAALETIATCDQCCYQKCNDLLNPECEPPVFAACPHAWWDSEYGTWREAEDDAPACRRGLTKDVFDPLTGLTFTLRILTRPDGRPDAQPTADGQKPTAQQKEGP